MRLIAISALCVFMFLMGCASNKGISIPQQIPSTVHKTCDTYQKVKPEIVKARAYAVANWDSIPLEARTVLREIDTYLPELDKLGTDICAASEALNLLESNQSSTTRAALLKVAGGVDWDRALSLVMTAANDYVTLKQTGVIH